MDMEIWYEPICCCKCRFSVLPRDFSKLDSIFCYRAVPGVGTVFAGVLRDNELKGRGCGCGGEVNKLSAALSRSALEPVNDSTSSPNRSSSSSLELTVLPFCFLMYRFLCAFFLYLLFCKRSADWTWSFKSDTGVVTLARFPTGRSVIMYIKWKAKMPAFSSRFVFIHLLGIKITY